MQAPYRPPYVITPGILRLVAEIGEWVGRYSVGAGASLTPRLRRGNRIRTIQASLAIENNTLTLEQVTAILDGKRVLGLPREIQEARNAFAAYECLDRWDPVSRNDLLEAHGLLMAGLVEHPGAFRRSGVGVFSGKRVVHIAPPAGRVSHLMDDLLAWLKKTDEHPLVSSAAFHYELEFIHPFADGNGRVGRLWQTLILTKWNPLLAYLPVETVIRDRREEYYQALAKAGRRGDVTPFIEFMLATLRAALGEAIASDQESDHVSDQVIRLLAILRHGEAGASDLMIGLGLSHRPTFRGNYLAPALSEGWIERTQPDSPRSPTQKYRLTENGRGLLARKGKKRPR